MSDLISSLAESIVALNNASPRLPTKQQIEEVLRPWVKTVKTQLEYAIRDKIAEKASKALRDAMNTSIYGGPTVEDREKFWANHLNAPFDKAKQPPALQVGEACINHYFRPIEGTRTEECTRCGLRHYH